MAFTIRGFYSTITLVHEAGVMPGKGAVMTDIKDIDILGNGGDDEELDSIIVLTDEDGNDVEFELLDAIELDGRVYVVLMDTDEENDGEVLIFEAIEDPDDPDMETYQSVDDEEMLDKIYEIFKERNKDDFDFE